MRTTFIAVAKIFGLLQVYYGLAYFTGMLPFLSMLAPEGDTATSVTSFSGANLPSTLVGILCTLVLTFGVAWLLLCRSTWLADKLRIPEKPECDTISKDTILLSGTVLIGLYLVVHSLPALVSTSLQATQYGSWFVSGIIRPVAKLALGLLLALKPQVVMSLLARGEKIHGKRIVIGSILILVALVVVGHGIANHPWKNHLRHKSYSTRTVPGSTVFVPRDTNTPSENQWYAVAGMPEHTSTNELPDFTNATIVDAVNYLQMETEKTEQ